MANTSLRERLYSIVFKTDTHAGRQFDIVVLILIIISVTAIILNTVESIRAINRHAFHIIEWIFTILFTGEYLLRVYCAKDRRKYITSFYGIVDMLAILPAYIGLFIPGTKHLLFLRVLRLMRIFRIFQMNNFLREGLVVGSALRASKNKIVVFLVFVSISTIMNGALMYIAEAEDNPNINNIPQGIYWAIATLTTVGYGDTVPITAMGKILASIVMILGYAVIAVPTGIVTAEISSRVLGPRDRLKIKCTHCGDGDHLQGSYYCHSCGTKLPAS